MDLGSAAQFFGHRHRDPAPQRYDFRLASPDGEPIVSGAGFEIGVAGGVKLLEQADTIVIPGYEDIFSPLAEETAEALRAAQRRGCRLVSICTGAFALGHAGLLDRRTATTHWATTDDLRRMFPHVEVVDNVLYMEDESVFTSGGVAAGIDLCLHLLRLDLGAEEANHVARRSVVAPHRSGNQAQFVEQVSPRDDSDAMTDVLASTLERLNEPLSVAVLARELGYSERTFTRRFRNQVGISPWQWIIHQRLIRGQQLLESTDLSIDQVAQECGFTSTVAFRKRFRERFEMSPTSYRRAFQGI